MPDLTPTFHLRPAFRIAGLSRWHSFAEAPQTIPPQWNEFNSLDLPGRAQARETFGATAQADMPNQRFEYLAGYELPVDEPSPAGLALLEVPAAEYAVFPVATVADIRPLWQHIFSSWLPSSAYKPAQTPNFERYDERFDPVSRGPFELWFPVQPRS